MSKKNVDVLFDREGSELSLCTNCGRFIGSHALKVLPEDMAFLDMSNEQPGSLDILIGLCPICDENTESLVGYCYLKKDYDELCRKNNQDKK